MRLKPSPSVFEHWGKAVGTAIVDLAFEITCLKGRTLKHILCKTVTVCYQVSNKIFAEAIWVIQMSSASLHHLA